MDTDRESLSKGAITNIYYPLVERLRAAGHPLPKITCSPPSRVPAFPDWLLKVRLKIIYLNRVETSPHDASLMHSFSKTFAQTCTVQQAAYPVAHPTKLLNEYTTSNSLSSTNWTFIQTRSTPFSVQMPLQGWGWLSRDSWLKRLASSTDAMWIPYKSRCSASASERARLPVSLPTHRWRFGWRGALWGGLTRGVCTASAGRLVRATDTGVGLGGFEMFRRDGIPWWVPQHWSLSASLISVMLRERRSSRY